MILYTDALLAPIYAQVRARGTRVALQDTAGYRLRFAALGYRVDTVAANLVREGMRPGDRALFLVRPGIDAIVLVLAIARAGGVLVLADIAMGKQSFESRVAAAAPAWVFAETVLLLAQRLGPLRRLLKRRGVDIPEFPALPGVTVVGVGPAFLLAGRSGRYLPLVGLLAPHRGPIEEASAGPESDALIVFTSGTTDLPKGVVHTRASLAATIGLVAGMLRPDPRDRYYSGHLHMIIPVLAAGGRAILPPHRASPRATLAHLDRHRITGTYAIPAELDGLIRRCQATGRTLPPSLRTLALGSAPLSPAFAARLQRIVPARARVSCMYGMTEMLPVCGISLHDKARGDRRGDPVGRPVAGVSLRLADDGELIVRGPHLFNRYLGGPPVLEHHSGDLATIDESGAVLLLGRKKDMIIRRGFNIYPSMIEPTILGLPGVRECALIGIPDRATGDEQVVLVVTPEEGQHQQALRRRLERALLAGPHSIDLPARPDCILFMPIPHSGRSQKVDKGALRAAVAAMPRR